MTTNSGMADSLKDTVSASKKASMKESTTKKTIGAHPKQEICVFEDGVSLDSGVPCYKFDLTAMLHKYFVYEKQQEMPNSGANLINDVKVQNKFYKHAVKEILDQCNY